MSAKRFKDNIRLGTHKLVMGAKPFVIAELSGNHQQSYELAEKMIDQAAASGADAIKLQTYTADSMTLDCDAEDFVIQEQDSLWKGERLHSLYAKAATPYEWHEPLFNKAKALGMLAFSSPFDEHAVDFLEDLNVPCYKIASFENNDLPLIRKVASTGKPIILSCGMASIQDIDAALQTAKDAGCTELILLKCTSAYPSPPEDINLATIADMHARFGVPVGLSDHSTGVEIALGAVALGACVIEKHFVLDRSAGGVDAEFSLEPNELQQLCGQAARVNAAIGQVNYGDNRSDQEASRYRRSIYINQEIKSGQTIQPEMIKIVRPGLGLPPIYFDQIVGLKARRDLRIGDATKADMFEGFSLDERL